MTNENEQKTQILMNFGPVTGNVERQEIHTEPPLRQEQQGAQQKEMTVKTGQLSISQQVILFAALLNEPLESAYGGTQSQLADFISQVSGLKPGSIRQKIMEIAQMDDYPVRIRQDAEKIAKLVEPYNSQVANDIRETYLED